MIFNDFDQKFFIFNDFEGSPKRAGNRDGLPIPKDRRWGRVWESQGHALRIRDGSGRDQGAWAPDALRIGDGSGTGRGGSGKGRWGLSQVQPTGAYYNGLGPTATKFNVPIAIYWCFVSFGKGRFQ